MNRQIWVLLASLLVWGVAQAENWVPLAKLSSNGTATDHLEVDDDSVRDDNGRVTLWLRIVYAEPRVAKFNPQRKYKSERIKAEFDCTGRQFRETGVAYHDEQGQHFFGMDFSSREWKPIRDDGLSGLEYRHACKGRMTQALAPPSAFKGEALEVQVHQISASSMLQILADYTGINVLAGDEFRAIPLDIHESAVPWDQLLDRLVREQGLEQRRSGKLVLIASGCRLSNPADVAGAIPYGKDLLSLNFQRIGTLVLPEIFAGYQREPFDASALNRSGQVTVRAKDVALGDHVAALGTVQGWNVTFVPKRGAKWAPNISVEKCLAAAGQPLQKAVEPHKPSSNNVQQEPCQRVKAFPSQSPCQALEYHPLSELRFLGFIKRKSSEPSIWALIAAPLDEVTYTVRVGDYVGPNFGVVSRISSLGITIRETVRNAKGVWEERDISISYQ
jgi:Tfp pilus assembly protein PilP